MEAAEEMHLKAGDGAVSMGPFCLHVLTPCLLELPAIIFNDHCLHGAAARLNEGHRRMVCFRYLPQHTSTNREPGAPSSARLPRNCV